MEGEISCLFSRPRSWGGPEPPEGGSTPHWGWGRSFRCLRHSYSGWVRGVVPHPRRFPGRDKGGTSKGRILLHSKAPRVRTMGVEEIAASPGLALERSSPVLTRRGDPSWRRVPPGGEYRLAAAPLPPRVPLGAGQILSPMESCEGPAPPGRVGEGSPSHAYTLIFVTPYCQGAFHGPRGAGREGKSFPPEDSTPFSSIHSASHRRIVLRARKARILTYQGWDGKPP